MWKEKRFTVDLNTVNEKFVPMVATYMAEPLTELMTTKPDLCEGPIVFALHLAQVMQYLPAKTSAIPTERTAPPVFVDFMKYRFQDQIPLVSSTLEFRHAPNVIMMRRVLHLPIGQGSEQRILFGGQSAYPNKEELTREILVHLTPFFQRARRSYLDTGKSAKLMWWLCMAEAVNHSTMLFDQQGGDHQGIPDPGKFASMFLGYLGYLCGKEE